MIGENSSGSTFSSALADLPDRLLLPIEIEAAAMAAEAVALPATGWTRHFVPDHYRGDWSVLPLRAAASATHPILQISSPPGCTNWRTTPYLEACPAIAAVLARFACPLAAVRLMRLGAGSQILEHVDHDLAADFGMVRLHVPLTSNPDVAFLVNRCQVSMSPGECWYLRLADPHSVINRGDTDRVHLVIDAAVDDWLARLLMRAAG